MSDELEELESGIIISRDSLLGKLITLKSNKGIISLHDKTKIYATKKWYYDRALKPMSDIEFDNYAARFKS